MQAPPDTWNGLVVDLSCHDTENSVNLDTTVRYCLRDECFIIAGDLMDAKEATMVVREYFESTKKIRFIFDVKNVEKIKNNWSIKCNVQNLFEEKPFSYEVLVDDETGNILEIIELASEKEIRRQDN